MRIAPIFTVDIQMCARASAILNNVHTSSNICGGDIRIGKWAECNEGRQMLLPAFALVAGLVELRGVEPLTLCLPGRCSPTELQPPGNGFDGTSAGL